MASSIKTIFKALLGTIFFMIMTSVCIELFNVNITGMQIRHMSKMAARQAVELFTQETYKIDNGAGAINAATIRGADGTEYIKGDFYYGLTNKADIYERIYGSHSKFDTWCNLSTNSTININDGGKTTTYNIAKLPTGKSSLLKTYTSLQALNIGLNENVDGFLANPSNMPSWDDADNSSKVKKWSLYSKAKTFNSLLYTPINLGIPYLDHKITNHMFQWNLARLASNCDSDLIQSEADFYNYTDMYTEIAGEADKKFVNYKGFKVFADEARITRYQYYVFDLSNGSDRDAYTKLTGNKVKVGGSGDGIKVNVIDSSKKVAGSEEFQAEDNYVAVVSIEYGVPITYIGITPIRNVFNYVWGKEVAGFNGPDDGALITDKNTGVNDQWKSNKEKIKSSSTYDYINIQQGTSAALQDSLFTTGYLTYTIVN